jgi:hypothetical protein
MKGETPKMRIHRNMLVVTAATMIISLACGMSGVGKTTPTSTDAPSPFPAWWSNQMTQDADGEWWPPQEIEQMVKEHYLQAQEEGRAVSSLSPPDYDAFEQVIDAWESGTVRENSLLLLKSYREHRSPISYAEWEEFSLQIDDWSKNGVECTARFLGSGWRIYEHDPATGDLIQVVEREEDLVMSIRMHYDPRSGHWKVHDFVELSTLGDSKNAELAEKAISEFVEALHIGEVESAYYLLDEEAQAQQSLEEFTAILETDANAIAFKNYQKLEVCETQVFAGEPGRGIAAAGLLHYEGGTLFFASHLRQDSNGVWRILSFRTDSEVEPKPWGDCAQD